MKILECIPNFSEGKNKDTINKIVEELRRASCVKILNFSMDQDHNRSVITFIGTPDDVGRGASVLCDKALELIDMRKHSGVHPRNGAVDVVPFVPIKEVDMNEATAVAHRFGRAFAERNNVFVYFYGEAALDPSRKSLAFLRKGGYETLKDKINDLLWLPDAGPAVFNTRSGATAVGARNPLIAFNINLDTDNIDIAGKIAKSIRESSGGLKHVQAIGVLLKSRNIVQVSMNLTNYKETSIRKVFDAVKEKARESGVDILESELIGLLPQNALEGVTAKYLQLRDFREKRIIETHC